MNESISDWDSPEAEDRFWSSLTEQEAIFNTAGEPPYDVDMVAGRIADVLGLWPDGVRLLDLGCGQGRLTNRLAQVLGESGSIHGVDISRPLLDRAVIDAEMAHLPNVHYWHGDGRKLPAGLGGRRYDLAYSVAMFQHIPHDATRGYIQQVHDRLKPGGVFTFTTAIGETDEFLNHQIADPVEFCAALATLFVEATLDPVDPNGWTWLTCRKAS